MLYVTAAACLLIHGKVFARIKYLWKNVAGHAKHKLFHYTIAKFYVQYAYYSL